LSLAVHVAESHPDQPQGETAAEREAREREEARLAAVAAEIARQEAEAAQRKAEARARRQAVEGPPAGGATAEHVRGTAPMPPRQSSAVPVRPADAVDQLDPRAPESGEPRPSSEPRASTGAAARRVEGPMALAFRLAREKKQRSG